MATLDDISSQIRAALAVSDPDLDTSIGTTTRKIIDAVAEAISEAYVDQHMLTYQYDINSKVGADLDVFTQLFGIARFGAKRATGYVIFTRPDGVLNTPVFIPVNTQAGTGDVVPVSVVTVTPATMQIGQRSVAVPVQAAAGGAAGNVAAGAINSILTPLQGVTQVTNIEALTGGTEQETDDALRLRWLKTVFRSLAGTAQMFLGIALDDPDCYAATVVGATSTRSEQVQVALGTATSNIDTTSVKFVYPNTAEVTATATPTTTTTANFDAASDTTMSVASTAGYSGTGRLQVSGVSVDYLGTTSTTFTGCTSLSNTVLASGSTVTQNRPGSDMLLRDYDYTFAPSVPPVITTTGSSSRLANGGLYNLSYEYVSNASRNVPTASVNNRIDVWCAGTRAADAQQSLVWLGSRLFNNGTGPNAGSPYAASLYVRPDGSAPKVGNVFIPLAFGPILTLPSVLSVGGTNFNLATGVDGGGQLVGDYQIIHRNDCFGWTSRSLFGIEWNVTHTATSGAAFSLGEGYTYNDIPSNVQKLIDAWRLVGTDAQAHQAKQVFLRFNLAVMYSFGASASTTNTAIGTNLSQFLQTATFGSVIQVSDVLNVISGTPGVDNVRFLSGTDYPGVYDAAHPNNTAVAIQKMVNGAVTHTYCDAISGRALDIVLPDDSVAVFDSIGGGGTPGTPSVRAQNTFGIN